MNFFNIRPGKKLAAFIPVIYLKAAGNGKSREDHHGNEQRG